MKNRVKFFSGISALLLTFSLYACKGSSQEIEEPTSLDPTTNLEFLLGNRETTNIFEGDKKQISTRTLFVLKAETDSENYEPKERRILQLENFKAFSTEECAIASKVLFSYLSLDEIPEYMSPRGYTVTFCSPLDDTIKLTETTIICGDQVVEAGEFYYIQIKSLQVGEKNYSQSSIYAIKDGQLATNVYGNVSLGINEGTATFFIERIDSSYGLDLEGTTTKSEIYVLESELNKPLIEKAITFMPIVQ